MLDLQDWFGSGLPIEIPAGSKTCEPSATLGPTDACSVRKLGYLPRLRAIGEIAAEVVEPAEQNRAGPVHLSRTSIPNSGQRPGFAETAFVSLFGCVIVRMHHDRFRTIDDSVTLGAAPAGVFVVFGILHFWQKTAFGPDVLANAAADHAEEMFPHCGLAFRPEASLIIVRVDGAATGTGCLAAKNGGGLRILQCVYQRAQPV